MTRPEQALLNLLREAHKRREVATRELRNANRRKPSADETDEARHLGRLEGQRRAYRILVRMIATEIRACLP
jgi:hypothetical protein